MTTKKYVKIVERKSGTYDLVLRDRSDPPVIVNSEFTSLSKAVRWALNADYGVNGLEKEV